MFGSMSYLKQKKIIIFCFLLIPVALLLLFTYSPAAKLVYFSFTAWDGYSPEKPWVGLSNYREVFLNPDIFGVFAHNFAYFVMGLVQNVIAIYFAVILNTRLRGRNLFRLLLFLPYIMSEIGSEVGYSDPAYFNKLFKRIVGMTPNEYKRRIQ